jgi:endonuclease/exonuclease/phosphatase family metal-dependent hydrolase
VREIYDLRISEGYKNIAIVGDLNDTPPQKAENPLAPLLADGSKLKDISTHPKFESDGREGTYANGTASNKIDYILLSPALFGAVAAAGVLRKGVWGGKNGTLFPHYDEMEDPVHAASDHAALWVELAL